MLKATLLKSRTSASKSNSTVGSSQRKAGAVFRASPRELAALVVLAGALLPGVAAGSDEFPSELRAVAGLECTPACSVCHAQDPGSQGTANKDFAIAMSHPDLGDDRLFPGRPETVATAYGRLDPDGDRKVLVTNSSGEEVEFNLLDAPCQAEVDYGCSVKPKPLQGDPASLWTPLLLAVFGLGVFARRRRVS